MRTAAAASRAAGIVPDVLIKTRSPSSEAVAGRSLLEASYAHSLTEGYRWHEFGDVHLVIP